MRKKLLQTTAEELYSVHGYKREDMPAMAGGTHVESYLGWIKASLEKRTESMRAVKIGGGGGGGSGGSAAVDELVAKAKVVAL